LLLASGLWLLGTGFWPRAFGRWLLAAGHWQLATGCRSLLAIHSPHNGRPESLNDSEKISEDSQ